jgi:CRP-like cAMP-binding protein
MIEAECTFIRRLLHFATLTRGELNYARSLVSAVSHVPAHHEIQRQDDPVRHVNVLLEGFACRYRLLADGRRQIIGFLVPGDPCTLQAFFLQDMDHHIETLAASVIATIPGQEVENVVGEFGNLSRAFWYSTLLDEAILREWLVNIGRRDAYERMAHMLWELYVRHQAVGRVSGAELALPLKQHDIADALALSTVYVNKTLQRLRSLGILELRSGHLEIFEPQTLQTIADFDPRYLHALYLNTPGGAQRPRNTKLT